MGWKLTVFIIFFLLIEITIAADIHGVVYDIELNTVKDVLVQINTDPKQQIVAKDGKYSFQAPKGDYTIKAIYEDSVAEEEITVVDEREYVLDLILYPKFEEIDILDDADFEINGYPEEQNYNLFYLIGIVLIVFAVIYLFKRKKKEIKKVPADLGKIVNFIKKQGGRTTQKELRKEFPLSEAKISLMITELEHKGIVKKIKKGRGNVIYLT